MLTSEDYRQLSNQVAQLAIASSAPSVAEALMAIALDYASRATKLSETTDVEQRQRNKRYSPVEGFGD
jgi:hypothetical protein